MAPAERPPRPGAAPAPPPPDHDAADDEGTPLASRLSPAALALERASLERILRAFRGYRAALELEVERWERNLESLRDSRHRQLLEPMVRAKCQGARAAGDANQRFLDEMLDLFEAQGGVDGVLGVIDEREEDEEGGGGEGSAGCAVGQQGQHDCAAGGHSHSHDHHHDHYHDHHHDHYHDHHHPVSAEDVDKVRYVLKNVARDWSAEGAAEREASYGRIVAELRRLFPQRDGDDTKDEAAGQQQPQKQRRRRRRPAVLIPGAGLARLCVDVAAAGLRAQGNEFSYYMLVASAFILNGSPSPECRELHPWAHAPLNQLSAAGQLRRVAAPDACPQDLLAQGGWAGGEDGEEDGEESERETEEEEEEEEGEEEAQEAQEGQQGGGGDGGAGAGGGAGGRGRARPHRRPRRRRRDRLPPLSMCAGDFEEVYAAPGMRARFDAVVTCFFLDTARNVVRYLEVVWHALRPGGYWVHFGPLLWHWGGASGLAGSGGSGGDAADDDEQRQQYGSEGDVSIELALDEVLQVARALGFREVRRLELVRAPYMGE
jgi:hypothetical protein